MATEKWHIGPTVKHRLFSTRLAALWLPLVLVASSARPSSALPNNRGKSLSALEAELRSSSNDDERTRAAIDELARRRTAHSVGLLEKLLLGGQPDAMLQHGLQALAASPSPHAVPLLVRLTRHRRPEVRRASYRALAAIAHPQVPALLGAGLRDSDGGVRAVCAQALGELGARSQLPLLFRALSRGVSQAAPAIGKLGDGSAVARFHEHLQRLPIDVMMAGYEQFLERPELPLEVKLDIVARLGEVASPSVKHFLQRLLREHDFSRQRRLRHAVLETAKRIAEQPEQRTPASPRMEP